MSRAANWLDERRAAAANRFAALPRMSATVAVGLVQKNATQPVGSSTRTMRIAPPAGRHIATNVLYRLAVAFPYRVNVSVTHPRFWPPRFARSIRCSP